MSSGNEFAPADLTDGRHPSDWKSRYDDPIAKRWILYETIYVTGLLAIAPILLFVVSTKSVAEWFPLGIVRYSTFCQSTFAWVGGLMGGTLFCGKWLYHAVAKQRWHLDRRLWRFLTPHLSAGLAFVIIELVSSGVLRILDGNAINSLKATFGLSFLIGYFSDSAIAKLSEIAETLFGTRARFG